jgi:effector-binding domain-containing protein
VIDPPQITETADQLIVSISLVVPRAEIQAVMGPAIREIYSALAAQGIAPAGPWFTHHRRRPTDTFDFAACVPVASPVAAAGRVQPGCLPAARVARTVYRGPYEGLGGAWGELCDWIEANGHVPREDLWECYVVGPESSHDPAAWRTELNRPLVS